MLRFAIIVLLGYFLVPASAASSSVTYYLYTRANPNGAIVSLGSVERAGINPNLPFKFLSHGWQDSIDAEWYAPAVSEYLRKGDYNVIAVDWNELAEALYSSAVEASFDVASVHATFIKELNDKLGVRPESVHLIGHSLGAHIFGLTGQYVQQITGRQVGRITGLDPAGPSWNGNPADQRLSPDDAVFVDAIHTDGNLLGYGDRLADADYFPNGGTASQNGCGFLEIGCSHNRAPIYFIESINSNALIGRQCSSNFLFSLGSCRSNTQALMGDNAPTTASGAFYLTTASSSPFGIAERGV